MKFITSTFDGSIAQATIKSSTIEQLKNAKPYYESAIESHTDKGQIKFFSDGLTLINKRLNKKHV